MVVEDLDIDSEDQSGTVSSIRDGDGHSTVSRKFLGGGRVDILQRSENSLMCLCVMEKEMWYWNETEPVCE